jgi:hypothetical protein
VRRRLAAVAAAVALAVPLTLVASPAQAGVWGSVAGVPVQAGAALAVDVAVRSPRPPLAGGQRRRQPSLLLPRAVVGDGVDRLQPVPGALVVGVSP